MGGLASGNPAGIAAALAPPRLALGGPRVAPEAAAAGARAAAPHAKLEISIDHSGGRPNAAQVKVLKATGLCGLAGSALTGATG